VRQRKIRKILRIYHISDCALRAGPQSEAIFSFIEKKLSGLRLLVGEGILSALGHKLEGSASDDGAETAS
jgi:hypothetical protein